MRNYGQKGEVLTLTAPYAVASGGGALVGALFVVATNAAANGARFEGATVGVFTLPKTGANTFAEGAKCYWDNSAKSVTSTATSNTLIGVATAAVASSDTTVPVRLGLVA